MEPTQDARLVLSESSVLMKTDEVIHSHRALRRELCCSRIIIIAFSLMCTTVSVVLFTQQLPTCKDDEHTAKWNDVQQAGALTEDGPEEPSLDEPYQAFLKIACKHNPHGIMVWERKGMLVGFSLSNDNGTLIIPSDGMYRVSLQVTYRGTEQVPCDSQMILEQHLNLYSDSYPKNQVILSSYESVFCASSRWRKSLSSEGTFTFEKGDRLHVTTGNLKLVDCDGNVGTKTFFTAHLHSRVSGAWP